jgi:hypothetical protein
MTEARGWKLAAFAQVVRSPLYAEVMICKPSAKRTLVRTQHLPPPKPRSTAVPEIVWHLQNERCAAPPVCPGLARAIVGHYRADLQ